MSDLAREMRFNATLPGVDRQVRNWLEGAADRIEALEAETELQKWRISVLQKTAVTRETWLKNAEAEVERLKANLRACNGGRDLLHRGVERLREALRGLLDSLSLREKRDNRDAVDAAEAVLAGEGTK
jgi:chromosome segregation ATPase